MNVQIIEVQPDRLGRKMPAGRVLPPDVRNRARWAVHRWVHAEGRSIREAQRLLLEELGIRRSIGSIWKDLANYECARCRDDG